jgi:hypothetical protein
LFSGTIWPWFWDWGWRWSAPRPSKRRRRDAGALTRVSPLPLILKPSIVVHKPSEALRDNSDALVLIPNQEIFDILGEGGCGF